MWGPFSAQTSELPLAGAGLQTAWWERGYGMGEGGLGRGMGRSWALGAWLVQQAGLWVMHQPRTQA